MNKSVFEEYIDRRYPAQINWYSDRAAKNKRLYQAFQWVSIVISISLPVLIAVVPKSGLWLTVSLAVLGAISMTALKAFRFQENWVTYRMVAEALKNEKFLFDAEIDAYADQNKREELFVERVEAIIAQDNALRMLTEPHADEEFEKK